MPDPDLPEAAWLEAGRAYRGWHIGDDGEGRLHAALVRAAPLIREAERERTGAKVAELEAALRRHTHFFTDHAGVELCGGCLRLSPCPDAALCGEDAS